uniref:S1 motif domain-containing protein n=1 Tax=Hemiselmis andersenii TaxID=464988 RepID=A0A6U4JK95_HEMAN|mmetsp:Transcript_12455/g.30415  ORF Transcript_12455/g.30415 Transcript_12455/m.30415 type:complete len:328 (+) Transcript_12455:41-1024(+)
MPSDSVFSKMPRSQLLAFAALAAAPMVAGFAPSAGLALRARPAVTLAAASPRFRTSAVSFLRMQEGDGAVAEEEAAPAGVSDVSDQEQRSLSKTRTNKRPRSDGKPKKPLSDYVVGEMCSGKIVSIMPYGAFVDVGTTTDGLVHVSQIADEFVSDIESVVKVGQEVECRIVSVDADTNKISLSMRSESAPQKSGGGGGRGGGRKELPEEFRNFDDKVFLPGKVASVQDYGCFVSLNDDVDALVHVSEMAEERVSSPSAVVKVGQDVQVRIIKYDKGSKRLSLSMKPWTEAAAKDEFDDIKQYVDPVPEDQKTSFAIAWEKAQAAAAK